MGLQAIPAYARILSHPEITDRNVLRGLCGGRSGPLRYGDFAITPTGVSRQFSVGPGRAFIQGQENSSQGGYLVWSDASENLLLAAPAASPVIDTLVCRVWDEQYGTLSSGTSRAEFAIVRGTPNASPQAPTDSSFNSPGANYVPGAWWRVCDFRTNPGDSTIPANQVYNPHTYARVGGRTLFTRAASTTGFGGRPTDAVAGDQGYEIDTGYHYIHNGTKWIRRPAEIIQVTASSWTSTTVFTLVASGNTSPTGGWSFPLDANSRYNFEIRLGIQANVGVALAAQLIFPAGSNCDIGWSGVGPTGGLVNSWTQNIASGATIGGTSFGGTGGSSMTLIQGQIVTGGTAGNFSLGFAQGSSNASSSFLLIGSRFKLSQVA